MAVTVQDRAWKIRDGIVRCLVVTGESVGVSGQTGTIDGRAAPADKRARPGGPSILCTPARPSPSTEKAARRDSTTGGAKSQFTEEPRLHGCADRLRPDIEEMIGHQRTGRGHWTTAVRERPGSRRTRPGPIGPDAAGQHSGRSTATGPIRRPSADGPKHDRP